MARRFRLIIAERVKHIAAVEKPLDRGIGDDFIRSR
jgi:hypothetical protein